MPYILGEFDDAEYNIYQLLVFFFMGGAGGLFGKKMKATYFICNSHVQWSVFEKISFNSRFTFQLYELSDHQISNEVFKQQN